MKTQNQNPKYIWECREYEYWNIISTNANLKLIDIGKNMSTKHVCVAEFVF